LLDQIAITTCDTCKRAWQDGGGVSGEISPAALERARCDAQEIGRVDAEQPERATQTIPPATRRLVLRRDRGTCKVPWCRSWRNIDVHHVVHREHGGTNDPLNLACLCELCRARHNVKRITSRSMTARSRSAARRRTGRSSAGRTA
jgi:hypothetical protein